MIVQTLSVQAEPAKILSLKYDNASSLIFISVQDSTNFSKEPIKVKRLENPNRIYFDINDSVLIGEKQSLVFEKSPIKEIKLAQFTTDPMVVRGVITLEEDFDVSKIKLLDVGGNIIVRLSKPDLKNKYFNSIYDETSEQTQYSGIVANSQFIQKVPLLLDSEVKVPENVMEDIQRAFENSILNNSNGKTYDSLVSVDVSSNLKLRTKYFINGYYLKNQGLLVSGLGQISVDRMFYCDSPKRVVIDMPNAFVDKSIRNKELALCPDGSCSDVAKIGQFEFNKARIVITSDNAEKYIPVYSADAQSLLFINADKLKHTDLVDTVANLNKAYVKKINTKTSEVILSFTAPVVHSILRSDEALALYLFNVQSYNEQDLIKTLSNTYYNKLTFSLLPQIGVRSTIKINKNDIVKIEQSVDGKALKLTITQAPKVKQESKSPEIVEKKEIVKNKIVIDPGHGGSDYGAIRDAINEKDITLDVSHRVAAILKSKGYPVVMSRTDDEYLSLEERVDFAEEERPQIFVSIHVNSAVATDPNGLETHYYHEHSKELAETIHSCLVKRVNAKDRGLFKSKFYVINHTTVPAVLVEMGFLSNPEERAELITESRKQKTAQAIAEGIIEYLKNLR